MYDIQSAEYRTLDKDVVDLIIWNDQFQQYIPLTIVLSKENNGFIHYDESILRQWIEENEDKIIYDEEKLKSEEIDRQKMLLLQKTELAFKDMISQGFIPSVSDKRFYARYDDIQKLKSGYDLAVLSGAEQMEIKTLDGVITLSIDNVKKALAELGEHYQKMLQKKWQYEEQIKNCQDLECLKNINIDFSDVANSDSSS